MCNDNNVMANITVTVPASRSYKLIFDNKVESTFPNVLIE